MPWPTTETALRDTLKDQGQALELLEEWKASASQDGYVIELARGLLLQRMVWFGRGEEKQNATPAWRRVLFRWKMHQESKGLQQAPPFGVRHFLLATELSHLKQWEPVVKTSSDADCFCVLTTRSKVYRQAVQAGLQVRFIPRTGKMGNFSISTLTAGLPQPGRFRQWMAQTLMDALKDWSSLSSYLDKHLASLSGITVGVGNNLTHEGRYTTHWAKGKRFSTWSIQHGAIGPNPLYSHLSVNRFFAFSRQDLRQLQLLQVAEERIKLTGAPYRDSEGAQIISHTARNGKLDMAEREKYVLVAWSGYGHMTSRAHYFQQMEALFGAIAALPNNTFILKLHRKEKPADYQSYLNPTPPNVRLVPYEDDRFPRDIFFWLEGASALITGNSSVAKEAMDVGVPVISLDIADEYSETDYLKAEVVPVAEGKEEMVAKLKVWQEDPFVLAVQLENQKEFLGEKAPEGKEAAQAILEQLEEMLGSPEEKTKV
ncbi:MAG TPA: hypothetical protein DCR93_04305 [Cytophagales bacterium]|nr:hypothetical protein [Cytophagales bacterium]HAP58749.1 hypothetical protein [Cytophagales bacterium]